MQKYRTIFDSKRRNRWSDDEVLSLGINELLYRDVNVGPIEKAIKTLKL